MIDAARGEVELRARNQKWQGTVWVGGVRYAFDAHNQTATGDDKFVYFHHRLSKEGEFASYGFGTEQARDLFRILIAVSGVGPATALALMNQLPVDQLVTAILQNQPTVLAKAKGISAKTAGKIILDVKKRIQDWASSAEITIEGESSLAAEIQEEVLATLGALGYSQSEIQTAISAGDFAEASAEDAIADCIRYLSIF